MNARKLRTAFGGAVDGWADDRRRGKGSVGPSFLDSSAAAARAEEQAATDSL